MLRSPERRIVSAGKNDLVLLLASAANYHSMKCREALAQVDEILVSQAGAIVDGDKKWQIEEIARTAVREIIELRAEIHRCSISSVTIALVGLAANGVDVGPLIATFTKLYDELQEDPDP